MTATKPAESANPDFDDLAALSARFLEKQNELWTLLGNKTLEFAQKTPPQQDPMALRQSVLNYWAAALRDPSAIMDVQQHFVTDCGRLAQYTFDRLNGKMSAQPVIPADKTDRRFKDPRWTENPVFDHMRQSYLLVSQLFQKSVGVVDGIDPAAARKLRFAARQYADAFSPSNFWMTNPEVLDETFKTRGENLIRGMDNLIADLRANNGLPRVSMVKKDLFAVGKNLAATPGRVMFQNDLLQVIQYEPTTKTVFKTPLVIVSPWINKYYILDMAPENSFVKWAVEQGHTVFITSWANPDERHRDYGWFDYMEHGLRAAIKAAQKATGEKTVNVIGYCIGGTLLASMLAYDKARGVPSPVKSATYFTAMIDFDDAGELTLFTDEAQIKAMEDMMAEHGYLDAWHLHTTFNLLRANDLIWSFVVNNYLLGREPFPFDLLYWNSDSTRIPAACHSFYLRNMYLHNNLAKPGKLVLNGTALNVHDVDTPSYFISTIDDHIAPWKTTYAGAKLLGGDVVFTLAGSGHIAGVVNPPVKNKYGFWTNAKRPNSADEWFNGAKQHDGSWWPNWAAWVAKHGGKRVPARKPAKGIEAAPGSYVTVRAL